MHVPKSNPLFLVAVSLTFTVACARAHRDSTRPASPPPSPAVETSAKTAEAPAEPKPTPAAAPTPKLNPAELEAEFEVQQRKIEVAVERLEREHRVYALESNWRTKLMAWWPWEKKKDREAIAVLIDEVERAAERQVEIAHDLKNADLAVRAEVERDRAMKLLNSLENFNAHDHNVSQ